MMNCISADKLTMYVDGLLEPAEQKLVMQHLKECKECRLVVVMFEEENQVLKETLSAPKLPDAFTDELLDQLEPLKSKWKANWIRTVEVAAAVILCIGLASAVSPGFGGFVSSLFSSETETSLSDQVLANLNGGFIYPVNYVAEGEDRKLVIEHLIVDVNQIGFTFKVTNDRGKVLDPDISISSVYFKKPDGSLVNVYESSIEVLEDGYAYYETQLSHVMPDELLTLNMEIVRLAEKDGHVVAELPVDFSEAMEQAKVIPFEDGHRVIEEHEIHFEKLLVTPNQTTLTYTIGKTAAYEQAQQKLLGELQEMYGQVYVGDYAELSFTLTNGEGEQVARLAQYSGQSEKLVGSLLFYPSGGRLIGHDVKFEQLEDEQLNLHVNGIYYSRIEEGKVTFNTERLTLTKPKLELDTSAYTVRNMNMQEEHLVVSMDVEVVSTSDHFYVDSWVLIDGKGDRYKSHGSDSSIDDNGIGYVNVEFNKPSVVGPYTLVALSSTKYVPLKEPIVMKVK